MMKHKRNMVMVRKTTYFLKHKNVHIYTTLFCAQAQITLIDDVMTGYAEDL